MVRKNFTLIVFLVIVLGVAFAWLCKGNNSTPTGKPVDSVFYWKNKAGDAVASLRAAEEDFEVKEKGWVDSIAKVNKSKTKFIREAVTITEKAVADIEPVGAVEKDYEPVKIPDCPPAVKNMRQRFLNNYYDASVQIGDSSYMHLTSYDTLAVVWKRVKGGLQIDVSHANPSVKIEGLKAYRIADKKPKKWAIGLQAGYGYKLSGFDFAQPSIIVGIGVTRVIVRF